MTDYSKLVKALRWCSVDECVPCTGCPMNEETHGTGCFNIMHQRAAAAIEELQAELEKKRTAECWGCKCEKLEPKRGEWITIRLNNGGSYTGCSCCEAPIPTDTMLDYIPESESKYCYSCGAKMEVQDADK